MNALNSITRATSCDNDMITWRVSLILLPDLINNTVSSHVRREGTAEKNMLCVRKIRSGVVLSEIFL